MAPATGIATTVNNSKAEHQHLNPVAAAHQRIAPKDLGPPTVAQADREGLHDVSSSHGDVDTFIVDVTHHGSQGPMALLRWPDVTPTSGRAVDWGPSSAHPGPMAPFRSLPDPIPSLTNG